MRSTPLIAFAFAVACASQKPLTTPKELEVPPDGSKLLFSGKAEGAQFYACATEGWKLKAPDAEVVNDAGDKLRHYAGPTWEASDGSKVVGEVKAKAQVDAAAIPWLLLGAKATEGTGQLAHTRWIQRLETRGGKAPDGGCQAGAEVRVPYAALYRFWGS